jgi:arabinose-5-phosphate isomerase
MSVDRRAALLIAQQTLQLEGQALLGAAERLDESLADCLAAILECGGKVLTSGVGATGAIARRFAHLLCCVGRPAVFLHAGEALHGSSGAVQAGDLLILLSKFGETRETVELARIAAKAGGRLIGITEKSDSSLGKLCDVVLAIPPGPALDLFEGKMSLGSSLLIGGLCDALVAAVNQALHTSQDAFEGLHPGGIIEQRNGAPPAGATAKGRET